MELNENQQKWLLFGIGITFSFLNVQKAYAPNLPSPPHLPLDPNRKCPPGTYKDGIACCMAMTPQCNACKEESKRLGGFKCIEDNRPKSQADCPPETNFYQGPGEDTGCSPTNTTRLKQPRPLPQCYNHSKPHTSPVLNCPPGTTQYTDVDFAGICYKCGTHAEIERNKYKTIRT